MKKETKKRTGQKEEARELQLGTMIRQRREALGMSQTSLCQGFCSIPNLSRIENNEQLPSRALVRKLAQRLGVPARHFLAVLDHEDLSVQALHDEIINKMIQCDRMPKDERFQACQQIREKLSEMKNIADPKDISIQQFVLSKEALLGNQEGRYSAEETLTLQLEAMRLTHPTFDLEEIRSSYYTLDESALINQMANTCAQMGDRKRAIAIYDQLLKYIEKNDQALPGYGGRFCLIAKNYAIDLVKEMCYPDAIDIAEKGQRVAQFTGRYQFLPSLVAIQAESWFFMNNLNKSKELYFLALNGAKLHGDQSVQRAIAQEIKRYLNIDMPM